MVALSELHSRLEHLVSYSSQLIFVSGETIGQQQSLLEAFLGQQSELCEIAYLTANSKLTITDYRRQFVRQLLGETEGILSRPLNELLAPLNQHEGPVIICICQAENIPRQLLQEMWELVLQSRFAGNKQHLNVLLFGQPEWAEQAKTWIPANNRDKPLLLSNESVSSEFVLQDNTSVQALITHKRQLFEQRLKTRHQSPPVYKPLLKNWWMRLLLLCVFLLVFCTMLVWQYSAESLAYWQDLRAYISAQPAVESHKPDAGAPAKQDEALGLTQIIPAASPTEASADTENTEVTAVPLQVKDDALVTNWQSAISRVEQKQEAVELAAQPATAQPTATQPQTVEPAAVAAVSNDLETLVSAEQGLVTTGAVPRLIDYPVEDIVSEDQLELPEPSEQIAEPSEQITEPSEQIAEPSAQVIEPSSAQITEPSAQVTNASSAQVTKALVAAVQPNYDYDESALLALSSSHYVLQLSAMSSKAVLQEFIADQQLADSSWIYITQRFGGDWYVVLHKQSYGSLELARQASSALPGPSLASEPFVKQVATVKQEIALE